jgi:type II secretory pathway component PulF
LFAALTYPVVLLFVGTGVAIFLMSYVIPQLLTVLESSGRAIPTATLLLKRASNVLTQQWAALLGTTTSIVIAVMCFYRWPTGRRRVQRILLKLPLLGSLIKKTIVAQFAQVMSLLLRTGVPFLEALRLVRAGSRHLIVNDELEQVERAIERGSDIAPTLERSAVFPPLVTHIVAVGQESGELTEMLSQLKEGYETEVRLAISKFTAALEPILIIVMSAVVGFIVFATMMPILEATRAMQ